MMKSMDWKSENNFPDEFHGVACEVYRGDPNWIPESPGMLKLAFGPHNRYFDKNSAWIGCEPDMARLAGFYNPDLLINDQHVAFFGYWETIDAYHANRKLFSEFESWARDKGAVTVYGPINFTTFGSYRIRLDRFEDGCYPGAPYNPPYYPRFLEGLGFKIED